MLALLPVAGLVDRVVLNVAPSSLEGNPTIRDMTSLARTERAALCDLALELGPDAPTLSGEWTVKDLVVHLLVRESSPSAVGIVVPALSRLTAWESVLRSRRDLPDLVEQLREGPPRWSPMRLAAVDRATNTLEFFVHHEDIRRAQPGWEPRALDARSQDALWRAIRVAGRGLVRSAAVGVTLERSDSGERAVLKSTEPTVVVRGRPSELVLFVYGRQPQARVELDGAAADVAALTGADLGV